MSYLEASTAWPEDGKTKFGVRLEAIFPDQSFKIFILSSTLAKPFCLNDEHKHQEPYSLHFQANRLYQQFAF